MVVENTKIKTKSGVPLIVEHHPKDYYGYPFITLIQYRKQHMLTIVDNVDEENIKAYVLDMCGPEVVSEELVIAAAAEWYETSRFLHPISIFFSKKNLTGITSKIYKSLSLDYVSRLIGPVPQFPVGVESIKSIKRRRRKPIPATVEIHR